MKLQIAFERSLEPRLLALFHLDMMPEKIVLNYTSARPSPIWGNYIKLFLESVNGVRKSVRHKIYRSCTEKFIIYI